MGRMDLPTYWGGPYAVPLVEFEVGLRRLLAPPSSGFADLVGRVGWGSVRSPAYALDDLWLVGLDLSLGSHVR